MDKKEFAGLKVGDKVTVRKWDEMEKEYGGLRSRIFTPMLNFVEDMKGYCGKTLKIDFKTEYSGDFNLIGVKGTPYYFTAEMLESNNPKDEALPVIVEHLIRGNKTIVKLSNGKVGVARCNPEDAFDVFEGLRQAAARAYGKTLPLTFSESMANFSKAIKKAAKAAAKEQKKKEAEKPVFVPYLTNGGGFYYGKIGEETKYKDAIGRPLKVGDTVELYDEKYNFAGEKVIVNDGKKFISGLKISSDDITGEIGTWKMIKKRSFEEIADGEKVDYITYIKTEAAKNA